MKESKISTPDPPTSSILRDGLTARKAHILGLVLASQGIPFKYVRYGRNRYALDVAVEDMELAAHVLEVYEEENRPEPQLAAFTEVYYTSTSGLFVSVLLGLIHARIHETHVDQSVVVRYGADAALIVHGELYRLATALFLHGDGSHLLGNIAGIIFFCTAVISLTGVGAGWLMILISGIAGNALNAMFHGSQHVSIGSSTAVFGAVGILSALRFVRLIKEKGFHMKAFLPMGAGLALLALLGSSEHSDITAHLLGFVSGILLGSVYASLVRRSVPDWVQTLCLTVAVLIVALSWYAP